MTALPSRRTAALVGLYAVALASWWWFARSWGPLLITSAREGRSSAVLARWVAWYGGDRRLDLVLKNWEGLTTAVVVAGVCHLAVVVTASVWRRRHAREQGPWSARFDCVSLGLLIVLSLAFFVVTILAGSIHDYYFFVQIWEEILRGRDPWFLVLGRYMKYPLNAYGPLFTLFAPLTLIHPLAPKLVFALAFWMFAGWLVLDFAPRRRLPGWAGLVLLLWLANPYAWIEIACFGHLDLLVGLLCIAAVEARMRRNDFAAAAWISAGTLLKYFPGVLVPFLMLDGRRVRVRFLATTLALGALGMSLACLIWGLTALRPLTFAVAREPAHMSIFRFLTGRYSLFDESLYISFLETAASPILLIALAWSWSWTRRTQFEMFASCVLTVTVTLWLYKVGFAQYPMVLFVLGAYWFVRDHETLQRRVPLVLAFCAYFAWVAWFDVLLLRGQELRVVEWAGLVTFVLGGLLVASIVRAAPPAPEPGPGPGPEAALAAG
jgi:hypothetical protein